MCCTCSYCKSAAEPALDGDDTERIKHYTIKLSLCSISVRIFAHLTCPCIILPTNPEKPCNTVGLCVPLQNSERTVKLHEARQRAPGCVMLWNKQQVFVS